MSQKHAGSVIDRLNFDHGFSREVADSEGIETTMAGYDHKHSDMRIIMLAAHSTNENMHGNYGPNRDNSITSLVDSSELSIAMSAIFERLVALNPMNQPSAFAPPVEKKKPWRLEESERMLHSPKSNTVVLTSKEFEFINYMASKGKSVVTSMELLQNLDYPRNESGYLALKSLVYRLRKKIDKIDCSFPIKTVHGVGYSFTSNIVLE